MDIKKLIEIKEEKGYSSVDIAARSGVPVSTVYKIFQGQTEHPRKDTIEAIERALGLRGEETPEGDQGLYEKLAERENGGLLREDANYGSYNYGSSAFKMGLPVKKQGEYTTDDLDALPEGVFAELIDGVIYDLAAPLTVHQIIISELIRIISSFVRRNKGKCLVLPGPVAVRLNCDNKTEVHPDISVTCDRGKLINNKIFGAPDLTIEVLSPSNEKHDTVRKLIAYKNAGVREYWIVAPKEKKVFVYTFEEKGGLEVYSFRDRIPVGIYEGALYIDFAEIDDYIEEIFAESGARD